MRRPNGMDTFSASRRSSISPATDACFGYYLNAGGDTHVEVFENEEAEYSGKNQINHICFEVIDIDAAIAHIRGVGEEATDKSKRLR